MQDIRKSSPGPVRSPMGVEKVVGKITMSLRRSDPVAV